MTGSHGFVGTNLLDILSVEHEIIRWNVREDKVLPDCDVVIHLAGLAHDTKHTTEDKEFLYANTELTKKLYDRFLESGAKKFIFFSSIKAQDGDTAYARSKYLAEQYIKEVRIEEGSRRIYILRPCMIHGKGNKGNLNLLVKWVKKGWPWPLAAFENKRSFASMENVAFVVSELLKKDIGSGTYNICDDEAVSTNELIELICECLSKKTHFWRIPKGLMITFARIGNVLHLPLNTERLEKLTENYIVDNRKTKFALGIKIMPVDVIEGLQRTIQSMINDKRK